MNSCISTKNKYNINVTSKYQYKKYKSATTRERIIIAIRTINTHNIKF